ncbi:MAG: tetratricopeptide (TPR) repeat protein [Flavobacteriales bacterium]|jgi:tetratricopeptide (TPR) repeat protein
MTFGFRKQNLINSIKPRTMKTKLTTLVLVLLAGMFSSNLEAQDCRTTLSLFVEASKVKNYDVGRPYFETLKKDCPSESLAIYQYGEKMLKADLKAAEGDAKKSKVQEIILLLKMREQYFAAKTPKGKTAAAIGQYMFDYKVGTVQSQYDVFHGAWTTDIKTIKSSKNIYTYFKLAVDLFKEGGKPLDEIFDLYDDVQTKLSKEATALDAKLQILVEKEEAGQPLSSKDARRRKGYETNLRAFGTFAGSVDATFGTLADCKNLIPLYNKQFEENKGDITWINKAASRMLNKECTSDPMFKKLVEQLHTLNPSADSAKYLMILCRDSGDTACEKEYFEQALSLEQDPMKRAALNYQKAEGYRKAGSYGQARTYYNKALADNPSFGRAYLRIGAMYAASANSCGATVFEKRATYWLAADVISRAGRVDPRLAGNANGLAANYRAKAPSTEDIFNLDMAGKSVKLNCWIGRTVKVPKL